MHLSQQTSKPAYYIVDWQIFGKRLIQVLKSPRCTSKIWYFAARKLERSWREKKDMEPKFHYGAKALLKLNNFPTPSTCT
jgi:hypothetical protein